MTALELTDVELTRGDISLRVESLGLRTGGAYAVTGANGSGKSTLLSLFGLMLIPAEGSVVFREQPVNYGNARDVLEARRQIGYLMQNPYLFNTTVRENVASGLKLRRVPRREIHERVGGILERMHLSHLAGRNAHELSGGEAQRVALARTLVLDVEILLLDEPTANVDKENVGPVEDMILKLRDEKQATVVLTTHSHDQAERMAGTVIRIEDGRLAMDAAQKQPS